MTANQPIDPGASRRRFLRGSAALGAGLAGALGLGAPASASPPAGAVITGAGAGGGGRRSGRGPTILVNNIGYELHGAKHAVIADTGTDRRGRPFEVVDAASGHVVHRGTARYVGPVQDWQANH